MNEWAKLLNELEALLHDEKNLIHKERYKTIIELIQRELITSELKYENIKELMKMHFKEKEKD